MATISLYNHTSKLFADGSFAVGDTYKVMLCTSATFSAADTTLAGITKTEVANGNGYATGGTTLANVTVTTVTTNDAKFDADDVTWTVTGTGTSITAGAAIMYNATDANSPPVAFIDFGGSRTVETGNNFVLAWNANGIFTWTVS